MISIARVVAHGVLVDKRIVAVVVETTVIRTPTFEAILGSHVRGADARAVTPAHLYTSEKSNTTNRRGWVGAATGGRSSGACV